MGYSKAIYNEAMEEKRQLRQKNDLLRERMLLKLYNDVPLYCLETSAVLNESQHPLYGPLSNKHHSSSYSTRKQLITSILVADHVGKKPHLLLLPVARLGARRHGQWRQQHHPPPEGRHGAAAEAAIPERTAPPYHARVDEALGHLLLRRGQRDRRGDDLRGGQ